MNLVVSSLIVTDIELVGVSEQFSWADDAGSKSIEGRESRTALRHSFDAGTYFCALTSLRVKCCRVVSSSLLKNSASARNLINTE